MTDTQRYPARMKDRSKIIKQDLKAAYPGVRFSVRCESFAHYEEIRIAWKDGPTEQDVNATISNHRAQLRKGKYIRIYRNV